MATLNTDLITPEQAQAGVLHSADLAEQKTVAEVVDAVNKADSNEAALNALAPRVTANEDFNTAQSVINTNVEGRLSSVESFEVSQATKNGELDSADSALSLRADALELFETSQALKNTELDAVDASLSLRADDLELFQTQQGVKNTELDNADAALESRALSLESFESAQQTTNTALSNADAALAVRADSLESFESQQLSTNASISNSIIDIEVKDSEQDERLDELGPSITEFGGGNGVQSEDTAAVQAIIDQGHTSCYLPDNDNYYEILGVVVPQGQEFKFIGQSQSAVIAARGTVAVYGHINNNTNIFTFCENLGLRVFEDCVNGIFDLRFCRNAKISKVHVVDDTGHTAIGTLCKLDRSYQIEFDGVTGSAKGFSIYELGDSTGLEVLDTVKINSNCVWHSNYVMFTRQGALNIHNIVTEGKYRDVSGSDENTADNAGEARLAANANADDDTLTVDDVSQLNSGSLSENDLIYVGHGHNAEQVRVFAVSDNVITLDTPLRFAKGAGDPVIFGCVHHTAESVLSLVVPNTHCEKAYIGFHLTNCDGALINSAYTTSFELVRLVDNCRNIEIGPVTYGNVGWLAPRLIGVPDYHDSSQQHRNITLVTAPSGSASVGFGVIRNDSDQGESEFLAYSGGAKTRFERSLNTVINAELISHAIIDVSGILNLSVLDGLFEGHSLIIDFIQTATGNRNITGYSDNINLSWPMYLSSKPFGRDRLELLWSGGEWVDTHRVLDDLQIPPRLTNLNIASNDSNTRNKFKWKQVERVTGDIVYASGSDSIDPWIDSSGNIIVTPA